MVLDKLKVYRARNIGEIERLDSLIADLEIMPVPKSQKWRQGMIRHYNEVKLELEQTVVTIEQHIREHEPTTKKITSIRKGASSSRVKRDRNSKKVKAS